MSDSEKPSDELSGMNPLQRKIRDLFVSAWNEHDPNFLALSKNVMKVIFTSNPKDVVALFALSADEVRLSVMPPAAQYEMLGQVLPAEANKALRKMADDYAAQREPEYRVLLDKVWGQGQNHSSPIAQAIDRSYAVIRAWDESCMRGETWEAHRRDLVARVDALMVGRKPRLSAEHKQWISQDICLAANQTLIAQVLIPHARANGLPEDMGPRVLSFYSDIFLLNGSRVDTGKDAAYLYPLQKDKEPKPTEPARNAKILQFRRDR